MKKLLTILVLIMLIISFFQITSMYALYKEKIQGDYSTLLGAWEIKVNETEITKDGQVETFTISDTQLGYTASEYIQAGKIAPSGKGSFDIVIDPTNTDVSVIYQINLESIDIPNAQIKLLSVDNLFKKDEAEDVINTDVNIDGNLYTAVIPVDKIADGYKNHLKLNFEWVNEETNNNPDTILSNIKNATNKNVTWTTSDETIATVSNGVVTAVSEGTATITVTTADGSFSENCEVTVSDETLDTTITAVSTVLDKTEVTLKKGETEMLLATVYPYNVTNRNITWTSNNEDVATVSNGVVTAVAEGNATITVTSADGSFTDTCTVTVSGENDEVLQVVDVSLDKSILTLKTGETEALTPTIWSQTRKISIPLEMNLKQYTGEVIGNGAE